jgi:hypothetical protein
MSQVGVCPTWVSMDAGVEVDSVGIGNGELDSTLRGKRLGFEKECELGMYKDEQYV